MIFFIKVFFIQLREIFDLEMNGTLNRNSFVKVGFIHKLLKS